MSRRREIAQHRRSLADIAGIMSAMKGLALMETRALHELKVYCVGEPSPFLSDFTRA